MGIKPQDNVRCTRLEVFRHILTSPDVMRTITKPTRKRAYIFIDQTLLPSPLITCLIPGKIELSCVTDLLISIVELIPSSVGKLMFDPHDDEISIMTFERLCSMFIHCYNRISPFVSKMLAFYMKTGTKIKHYIVSDVNLIKKSSTVTSTILVISRSERFNLGNAS